MKSSSTTREGLTFGVEGAVLATFVAASYYLFAILVLILGSALLAFTNGEMPQEELLTPFIHAGAAAFLIGLIVAFPMGLLASVSGFLAGLIVPKLLAALKPRHPWQAGLIGFVVSLPPAGFMLLVAAVIVLVLMNSGPALVIYAAGIPILIFIASTTYIAMRLPNDKYIARDLINKLTSQPAVLWLLVIPLLFHIINLIYFFVFA